jgi:hypothetical protein
VTNDDAIQWCRRHCVVVIFHQDRIVLVLPTKQLDVEAFRKPGFKMEIRSGFTLAYTEPGDEFFNVVEAAQTAWRAKLNPLDTTAELAGRAAQQVKFSFLTDMG